MLRSGVDQTSAAHLWADIYRKGEEAPMININITALNSPFTNTTERFSFQKKKEINIGHKTKLICKTQKTVESPALR